MRQTNQRKHQKNYRQANEKVNRGYQGERRGEDIEQNENNNKRYIIMEEMVERINQTTLWYEEAEKEEKTDFLNKLI